MGEARVLFCDDEELMRKIGMKMIVKCGFEAVTVASGEDALKLLAEDARGFDVAIVDVSLPGISGIETCRRIRETRPDLALVLSSGFNEEQIAKDLGRLDGVRFLKKPFTFQIFSNLLSLYR